MISHHCRTIVLAATFAVAGTLSPAMAASFDGYWSLTARTTNGHCGVTRWDVAISGGRFFYPGGFLMGYPVSLVGAVSPSGRVRVSVMAGPRFAGGAGRLGRIRGDGAWSGRGPSGLCSGVWSATRVQPFTYGPSWRMPHR